MTGTERRSQIIRILSDSEAPVSGTNLAGQLGVSRQVIVQDIALLRANGSDIFSTNVGYLLQKNKLAERVFKVFHSDDEEQEALELVVDLGGIVKDVFVYHKVYGVVRADMNIRSRKDIQTYMGKLSSGKSSSLLNITSGYHYHTIQADSEETLDLIFDTLNERGFLAQLQDYEPINFWENGQANSSKNL